MLTPYPTPGPFTLDSPAQDAVVQLLDDDQQPVDVWTAHTVTASLSSPEGTPLAVLASQGDTPDEVVLALPVLPTAGAWVLTMTLDPPTQQVAPTQLLVEDPANGWLTLDTARGLWPDAARLTDYQLWLLLESARTAVVNYAPKPIPAVVPPNYVQAQQLQARAVWNKTQTDPSGTEIGFDQIAVRVWPMDLSVKQLVRPKSGKPVMW